MKKLSIIVPIYNVEAYLKRGLECLLTQSYPNIEIILVNDGSPDNCGVMCDEYAKQDNRIKVIHKENGGVSSARNVGIDNATGEYITFFDPDDLIDKDIYTKLVNALEKEDADMSMCGIKHVFEDGTDKPLIENNLININSKTIFNYFLRTGAKVEKDAIYTDNIMGSVCRVLFKKEIIGDLRFKKLSITEDLLFLCELINEDTKIAIVNERMYCYFQRSSSAMHVFTEAKIHSRIKAVNLIAEALNNKVNEEILKSYKFYLYANFVNNLIKSKNNKLLKDLVKTDLFIDLNNKENYKAKKRITKSFAYKVAYFLVHKKMFWLYSVLRKFAG